jgi:predicted esterase
MAMLVGLTFPKPLAGILAMSGYLPVPDRLFSVHF